MIKDLKMVQDSVYLIECFLQEHYEFRYKAETDKTEEWSVVTPKVMNSIVRRAKMEGICKKSPRPDIEEYINSDAVAEFDPIQCFMLNLPVWDGKNHLAELFNRIPGLTSEQLAWCCTWFRSMVAHWLGLDQIHGNEVSPVLIGRQGCGKTTFAYTLLPPELRMYFLDHINFGNKFDADMALTNNLLVNIDEFANMRGSQQGKLKQTLSRQKVNGRPIFGKSQEDRRRYASFIATTNDEQPLCDPTESVRQDDDQQPVGHQLPTALCAGDVRAYGDAHSLLVHHRGGRSHSAHEPAFHEDRELGNHDWLFLPCAYRAGNR